MQKNEDQCLEPWIRYHGHLFGFENIFLIDHASTSGKARETLRVFAEVGVNVLYLSAEVDYREKGKIVSDQIIAADNTSSYDFLFPMDCDEFLCARASNGDPTVSRNQIYDILRLYQGEVSTLQINENFMNQPPYPGYFVAAPYQKVFFARGCCDSLDHGSHVGVSKLSPYIRSTPFIYMHFHFKKYQTTVEGAREKLLPWIDPDDLSALELFNGPGHHLKRYFLETEDQYYSTFTNKAPAFYFTDFIRLCNAIGIDPNFAMSV